MIQGQYLDALFANLMEENVELNATEEGQVMSPFPLQLFTQGPPQGPHVLM